MPIDALLSVLAISAADTMANIAASRIVITVAAIRTYVLIATILFAAVVVVSRPIVTRAGIPCAVPSVLLITILVTGLHLGSTFVALLGLLGRCGEALLKAWRG